MRAASARAWPTSFSSALPGSSGTWLRSASSRAVCLSPNARICAGVGPMKAMPAAEQASAKSGFSDRKP